MNDTETTAGGDCHHAIGDAKGFQLAVIVAPDELSRNAVALKDMRTQDDPQVRQPDISKANAILGWEPAVELEEGLSLTIPWFREQLRRRGELP